MGALFIFRCGPKHNKMLAELAYNTAVNKRKECGSPLELFKKVMLEGARKGLFSVMVELNNDYGSVGFFRSPETQDWIGDSLSYEGILVSFGEPLTPNGYPTMKLDWYKTRRVVKMSKI